MTDLTPVPGVSNSPHLVIVGAGASKAACPHGDAEGRLVPVMSELARLPGIQEVLESANIDATEDFETLFDRLARFDQHRDVVEQIKRAIWPYFSQLRLPSHVTVYDELVMCLSGKDVIASFNWDPLLAQALQRNAEMIHRWLQNSDLTHSSLPQSFYLHGNVAVGFCTECRRKMAPGRCQNCNTMLSQADLLYPIGDKNYISDPFIAAEWRGLKDALRTAYYCSVFGYRMPTTDAAAREAIHTAWNSNASKQLGQFEVIDRAPVRRLRSWKTLIVRHHYGICRSLRKSDLTHHPRGTCKALAQATLMLDPMERNPLPRFRSLARMHEWFRPRIEEELATREP